MCILFRVSQFIYKESFFSKCSLGIMSSSAILPVFSLLLPTFAPPSSILSVFRVLLFLLLCTITALCTSGQTFSFDGAFLHFSKKHSVVSNDLMLLIDLSLLFLVEKSASFESIGVGGVLQAARHSSQREIKRTVLKCFSVVLYS